MEDPAYKLGVEKVSEGRRFQASKDEGRDLGREGDWNVRCVVDSTRSGAVFD
jgi:hypothetical protein